MKILNGIAIAAFTVLLASAAVPVHASCSGSTPMLNTADGATKSFIWTEGYFQPYYISVPGYPPWSTEGELPVSPGFSGVFWALGVGNPASGMGNDNGTHTEADWFSYYIWYGTTYYTAGAIGTDWAVPGVDGCLYSAGATGSLDGDECTCVLLSDQDGGQGYYAIASAQVDVVGNTYLDMAGADGNGNSGPIILRPIPKPFITNTMENQGTLHVDVTATVAPFSSGVYAEDGCDCGPVGYKLLQAIIPAGDPFPTDRNASSWTEPELAGGGAQTATPFGSSVTIESTCGGANTDVFLATLLVFDSGFSAAVVSENSTRISCGPNLADPWESRSRPAIRGTLRDPIGREQPQSRPDGRSRGR